MCVENNAYLRQVKGVCVKNDTSFSPTPPPIALAVEERTRFNATIPAWLRAAIDVDCRDAGIGPRKLGGDQAVVMTALLAYLELPRPDRLRLARSMSARDEESVRGDFNAHWIGRAMKALNELGETAVPTLEAAVKVVRQRQREQAPSRTPGSVADPLGEAPHRSRRRRVS